MQKLHPDKLPALTSEHVAQILSAYGIRDFSYEPITQGLENLSIKVSSGQHMYVLRIYRDGKATPETISLELAFQDYLLQHNIPTPRVYPNTEGKKLTTVSIEEKQWNIALMEFIEGQSATKEYTPNLIEELSSIQARMHILGIQYAEETRMDNRWTELHDNLHNRAKDLTIFTSRIASFIERAREFRPELDPALPHGYNHLDLDLDGNVITKDDSVRAIIDFDDLSYSPSVVCLGYTLREILATTNESTLSTYLAAYESIRPLHDKERAALPYILSFRNYVIGLVDLLLRGRKEGAERAIELEALIPTLSFAANH